LKIWSYRNPGLVKNMKLRLSKIGVGLAVVFLTIIMFLIIMFPFSMGFSWLLAGFLSRPWNETVSPFINLQYHDMNPIAVVHGLLINTSLLYLVGYGIERFGRRLKSSQP